jgi:hypothetical protein
MDQDKTAALTKIALRQRRLQPRGVPAMFATLVQPSRPRAIFERTWPIRRRDGESRFADPVDLFLKGSQTLQILCIARVNLAR